MKKTLMLCALLALPATPALAQDANPAQAEQSSQVPSTVPSTWRSVDGELEIDGRRFAVTIDRAARVARVVENVGSAAPTPLAPFPLSAAMLARVNRSLLQAAQTATGGITVDGMRVRGQRLWDSLKVVALSSMHGSEPTFQEVSGQVMQEEQGLVLDDGEGNRWPLRGLHDRLERAAGQVRDATLSVLTWTRESGLVDAVVTGIKLNATQESQPDGIQEGEDVKVIGLDEQGLKVVDKKGKVGRIQSPAEAKRTKEQAKKALARKKRRGTTKPASIQKPIKKPIAGREPVDGRKPIRKPIDGRKPIRKPLDGRKPTTKPSTGSKPALDCVKGHQKQVEQKDGLIQAIRAHQAGSAQSAGSAAPQQDAQQTPPQQQTAE